MFLYFSLCVIFIIWLFLFFVPLVNLFLFHVHIFVLFCSLFLIIFSSIPAVLMLVYGFICSVKTILQYFTQLILFRLIRLILLSLFYFALFFSICSIYIFYGSIQIASVLQQKLFVLRKIWNQTFTSNLLAYIRVDVCPHYTSTKQ